MVNFVACSLIAVISHQLLAWDIWYQFYCCFSHPLQLQLCQAASDLNFCIFRGDVLLNLVWPAVFFFDRVYMFH